VAQIPFPGRLARGLVNADSRALKAFSVNIDEKQVSYVARMESEIGRMKELQRSQLPGKATYLLSSDVVIS